MLVQQAGHAAVAAPVLRMAHPWPHRDGAGPGIVGGPHRGVAAPAIVSGAIAIAFNLALAFTLTFVTIVGAGGWGQGAIGGLRGSC
jgi:hypothetical protein